LVIALLVLKGAAALCAGASVVTAAVRPPASGPLVPVWGVLNWLAVNKGFAANAVAEVNNLPVSK
jgi:hypothetical protein